MSTRASIIVPAHNEEAVIARGLARLLLDAEEGEWEIIVVCNACDDRTADIAKSFRGVEVVEIPEASKMAALEMGDAAASSYPRLYLDADVLLDTAVARQLVSALAYPHVEAASPRVLYEATGRPWTVRTYYSLVQRLPVFQDGYVGTGVFGLSAQGRARFERWPKDLPDDAFVSRLVPAERRITVEGTFTFHLPRSLRAEMQRAVRVQGLNRKLERSGVRGLQPATTGSTSRFLLFQARSPRNWPAIAIFVGVAVITRARARWAYRRGRQQVWLRDESSRSD